MIRSAEPGAERRAATVAILLLLDTGRVTGVLPAVPAAIAAAAAAPASEAASAERRRQENARRLASAPADRRATATSRLTAEQRYAEGRRFLTAGHLGPARRELEAAAEALPSSREYALALTLCDWLLATDPSTRAVHGSRAEQRAMEILRDDRRCALAHYVQGRLRAAAGDEPGAAKAVAIAASLAPTDREFMSWMRVLKSRASR